MPASARPWYIYLLDCDGRLYTGVSTDPDRRLGEHRSGGSRAARFVRGSVAIEMPWKVAVGSRSDALRAEYRLRRLRRSEKLAIIAQQTAWSELRDRLFAGSAER